MYDVLIFGASGSIGTQTLDVLKRLNENYKLVAFTIGNRVEYVDKILNDLITELDNNKAILQSKTQDNIGLNSDATNQIIEAGMLKDILDSKYILLITIPI